MTFEEKFPGFTNQDECARMYWRASTLDIMSTTTWFHADRTRAGLAAIIEEAIIDHARRHYAAIRSTVGSECNRHQELEGSKTEEVVTMPAQP